MKTITCTDLAAARTTQARIDATLGYPKQSVTSDARGVGGYKLAITQHAAAIVFDVDANTWGIAIEDAQISALTSDEQLIAVPYSKKTWDGSALKTSVAAPKLE